MLERLLAAGAQVETTDSSGNSPLMRASYKGYADVMRLLISAGAQINRRDIRHGFTALMKAAVKGHLKAVNLLLERGARPNITDKAGRTALMMAAFRGHERVVKALLDGGSDPEVRDKFGKTALWYAQTPEVVQLLHQAGVSESGEQ